MKNADVARAHSNDLMRNNITGHTGSDGSNVRQRIERAGITNTRYRAENCAYGQRTPEDVDELTRTSCKHSEQYSHSLRRWICPEDRRLYLPICNVLDTSVCGIQIAQVTVIVSFMR